MIPAFVVNLLAVVGGLFLVCAGALFVLMVANDRAGRRHERAARQVGGWR